MTTAAGYESTSRAIIRCSKKGCRTAHRKDFATIYEPREFNGRLVPYRAVIVNNRQVTYRDRYDLARIMVRDFTCTGCGGHLATFDVVDGSFSESVKCGARCRNAVGPSCECSCAGENHASGHHTI